MDVSSVSTAAETAVYSTPVSPPFYVALVFYFLATVALASMFTNRRTVVGRLGQLCLWIAFVAHMVEIGWRGVEHVHPGTSVREALGFLSWLMVAGYLLASLKNSLQIAGAFVAPLAMGILAAARLSPTGDRLPGLSLLGRIHISLATIGVAIFAMATVLAVTYLLAERNLKRKRFDGILFRRGIALESLDMLARRLVIIGFPIFTASLMLGVVWVSQRGSGLDHPQYGLALITWLSFAALLITRTTHGWRGRKAAVLTIVGFTAALIVFGIYFARRALF